MSETANQVYQKSKDFVYREVAGEYILVPIRRRHDQVNSLYVLNETGAEIWKRIDGQKMLSQIIEELKDFYDVEPGILSKDAGVLFKDLLSIEAVSKAS